MRTINKFREFDNPLYGKKFKYGGDIYEIGRIPLNVCNLHQINNRKYYWISWDDTGVAYDKKVVKKLLSEGSWVLID